MVTSSLPCAASAGMGAVWDNAGLLLLPEEDEGASEANGAYFWAGRRHEPAPAPGSGMARAMSPPAGGGVVLEEPRLGLGQEDSVSSVGAAPATPFPAPGLGTRHPSPAAAAAGSGVFAEGAIVRAIARLSPGPDGRQGRAAQHVTGLLLSPPPAEGAAQAFQEPPAQAAAPVNPPPAAAALPPAPQLPEQTVADRPPARPLDCPAPRNACAVAVSDLDGAGGGGGGGGGGGLRVVVRVGDECRGSASAAPPPWAGLRGGQLPNPRRS